MADALPDTPPRAKHTTLRPFRMDMTPLVDLAFLLLTFFILTSELSQPTTLQFSAPVPGKPMPANNVLTLLLAEHRAVYAYTGAFDPQHTVLEPLDDHGVRARLLDFARNSPKDGPPPVCIIKATEGTRYGRVIDVVDEVTIAGIGRFSVQDSLYAGEHLLLERAALATR